MAIRLIVWAFDQRCPGPSAKLVLIKLADHASDEGECWPSQGRIASDCGLSRETVNRQIKLLISNGLVGVTHRITEAGQQANRYFLRCDGISHPGVTGYHTAETLEFKEANLEFPRCDGISHRGSPGVTYDHTEPLRVVSKNPVATRRSHARARAREAGPGAGTATRDDSEVFGKGVALLGENRRGLIAVKIRQWGLERVAAALNAVADSGPHNPVSYFVACCDEPRPGNGATPPTYVYQAPRPSKSARECFPLDYPDEEPPS